MYFIPIERSCTKSCNSFARATCKDKIVWGLRAEPGYGSGGQRLGSFRLTNR